MAKSGLTDIPSEYGIWKVNRIAARRGYRFDSDIARTLGMTRQAYYIFKQRKNSFMNKDTVRNICDKFCISLNEFLEDYEDWTNEHTPKTKRKLSCIVDDVFPDFGSFLQSKDVKDALVKIAKEKGMSDNKIEMIQNINCEVGFIPISITESFDLRYREVDS